MITRGKILLLFLGSMSFAAGAKNISNFEEESYPVIVPEVRHFIPLKETFPLPRVVTVRFPEEAAFAVDQLRHDFAKRPPGRKVEPSRTDNAAIELVLQTKDVPKSPEGYRLRIDARRVRIASRSPAGLFYGMQTLRAILRNSSPDQWKGCEIIDEPTFPIRCVAYYNLREMESADMPCFKDAVDLLSGLKFNMLFLEFADNFPMRDSPFTLRKSTLTKAEFDELVSYSKTRHMEIIPAVQAISHVRWMDSHPAYKTQILENPKSASWNNCYCLSKPLGGQLTLRVIREQLAFFKPRFYSPYLDEIASGGMPSCPECRKNDPVKLVGNHIREIEKAILEGGAIPLVFHDAFTPGRDGGYGAKILKTMHPSTHIAIWDYNVRPDEEEFKYFAKLGFPLLGSSWCAYTENNMTIPRLVKKYNGVGCILYNGGWVSRFYSRPEKISANIYAATVLAANYYWNPDACDLRKLSYDPGYEFRLRYPENPPPERRKGIQALPVSIRHAMNIQLGDDDEFPMFHNSRTTDRFRKELENAPEKFRLIAGPRGTYYGIALSAAPADGYPAGKAVIPVDFKASKLSCLLMTSRPNSMSFFVRKENLFPLVAELRLKYADGTENTLPLQYRWNLNHWNTDCSGYAARYVLSGADDRNSLFYFLSADWDNLPSKRVVSMEFSAPGNPYGVVPVLLAVSAFDGENYAQERPILSGISKKKTVEDKQKDFILADFRNGLGKARVSFEGKFTGAVRYFVDKGELLFEIPPKQKGERQTRLLVNVPVEPMKNLKSLIFSMSCDRPEQILRSGVYVGTEHYEKHLYRFRVEDPTIRDIQEVRVPFSSMKNLGNLRPNEITTVCVSFWLNNELPMTLRLDNIGVSEKEVFDRTPLRTLNDSFHIETKGRAQ